LNEKPKKKHVKKASDMDLNDKDFAGLLPEDYA
jgi:hypothetical protein